MLKFWIPQKIKTLKWRKTQFQSMRLNILLSNVNIAMSVLMKKKWVTICKVITTCHLAPGWANKRCLFTVSPWIEVACFMCRHRNLTYKIKLDGKLIEEVLQKFSFHLSGEHNILVNSQVMKDSFSKIGFILVKYPKQQHVQQQPPSTTQPQLHAIPHQRPPPTQPLQALLGMHPLPPPTDVK